MTPDLKALLERWRECYRPGGPHTDELTVAAALESLDRENERMRQYIKVIFRHVDIAYSARELRIIGMNKDADLLVQCAMDARAILDAQDEPGGGVLSVKVSELVKPLKRRSERKHSGEDKG